MNVVPGDVVRLKGWRGVYRVKRLRPDGFVDVWGGTAQRCIGLKTVEAHAIKPSRRGDIVPDFPPAFGRPLPRRKAVR